MNNKNLYLTIVAILVIAGAIAAFKINGLHLQNQDVKEELSKTDNQSTPAPTGCPDGKDPMAKYSVDQSGRFVPTIDIANKVATLDTSMGKIKIAFYDKDAPKTVENFICLAEKSYYNGIIFHRVAKDFVIQAGDPTGTGMGGESIYGGKFEDEIYSDSPSVQTGYVRGVVAMANAGENTNGSQFFIVLKDAGLPPAYTIFGKVIAGQDVVDKIGAVKINPTNPANPTDGKPIEKVTIKSVTVETVK